MKRIEWVDTLRGIAALMVVILHTWLLWKSVYVDQYNSTPDIIKTGFDFISKGGIDFGKIGVAVFFIVSGYVIPYSLEKKSIDQFLVLRFFRLYPLYWFILILAYFVYPVDWNTWLINFTMFQKFIGVNDVVGVFWTLQIEWIFYIMCIVLKYFKVLENNKFIFRLFLTFTLINIVTAYFRYRYNIKLPVGIFLGLELMLIGLICNRFDRDKLKVTRNYLIYMIIVFSVLLLPTTIMAYSFDLGNQETWYRYFFSYITALAIFFIVRKYQLSTPVFLILGTISYSLYLIHPLIIDVSLRYNFYFFENYYLAFLFSIIVISIVISYISYKLIESKSINLYKKLNRK